jgi:biopolymer transport protein ExbD
MNVGSSSGDGEPEVMMDVNTTPLIDVMLVLLVMLIITSRSSCTPSTSTCRRRAFSRRSKIRSCIP